MHETSTEGRVFLKKKEPLLGMPGTVDRLGYQIIIQKQIQTFLLVCEFCWGPEQAQSGSMYAYIE